MRRAKSLKDAKNIDEVCKLDRDNLSIGKFWILSDGYSVTLTEQRVGEASSASVTIPRRIFNGNYILYSLNNC